MNKLGRTIRKLGKTAKKLITRKRGPLPTWGWIAAGSIVLIVWRRHMASGSPWPWQSQGQQSDTQQQNQAYTSPTTPPNLAFEPGGALPVDMSGAYPSSGGDYTGLLAILKQILSRQNRRGHHRHVKRKHNHKLQQRGHKRHRRARSHAHVRVNGGGRTKTHVSTGGAPVGNMVGHFRKGTSTYKAAQKLRDRPKVPAVAASPREAQHLAGAVSRGPREAPRPAPRPSAPAKRTIRSNRGR